MGYLKTLHGTSRSSDGNGGLVVEKEFLGIRVRHIKEIRKHIKTCEPAGIYVHCIVSMSESNMLIAMFETGSMIQLESKLFTTCLHSSKGKSYFYVDACSEGVG